MYARTVALVLIAAIVACPMRCGNGLCHAGQCCPARQSTHHPCQVHGTASCCCDRSSPGSNDDCPCDAPCKSTCQGVCGGAVFAKPCELNDEIDSFFLPLVATDLPFACQRAEFCTRDGKHLLRCGGNPGRSLRTLQMSLLC